MKILIKSVLECRGETDYSTGKVDFDELKKFVDAVVNTKVDSEDEDEAFENLGEFVCEACMWANMFDWEHEGEQMRTFLVENMTKLSNGQSFGSTGEEDVTVFVPMTKNDGETNQQAAKRVDFEASTLIAQLLCGEEMEEADFDDEDWG